MQTPLHQSRFTVGIDLGTTNSVVSCVDHAGDAEVRLFAIPQLVAVGEVDALPMLPSFCILPGRHELPEGALGLPWAPGAVTAVGAFARDHGALVPGRLVASAKSWLAHGGVDRTGKILPWRGEVPEEECLSPVKVSALFLEHVRCAWDAAFARVVDENGSPCVLADQEVVLTVPASFDEAARELTLAAAREAGLLNVTLLEEPLAAFYNWLRLQGEAWSESLAEGDNVLVVDVGGGTTDFSLVRIEPGATLRRTAVGDHLLLGGDNVDMALARRVEHAWGTRLAPREWSALCQQCRMAKEHLLTDSEVDTSTVTVAGSGGGLVAGTRSSRIERAELRALLEEGFFPEIPATDTGLRRRAGVREMGLPFADDPAVTRHLLAFLTAAGGADGLAGARPTHVLFNGGSLQPALIRERVAGILGSWYGRAEDLNTAVSRGAAYYGLARRGQGVRVQGGLARAYFLEVSGTETPVLLCVMPRDRDEGRPVVQTEPELVLQTNVPVRFPLFSSSTRLDDKPGDVVLDRDELSELPPLTAVLPHGRRGDAKRVRVRVGAVLNEIGTLDLWLDTHDGSHRYPLSFDLRAVTGTAAAGRPEVVVDEHVREQTRARMLGALSGESDPARVMPAMEECLGQPRGEWGATLVRDLADTLLEQPQLRERGGEVEQRWWHLVGFLLRPGTGMAGDDWRLRQLWKHWHRGPGTRSRPELLAAWWTCWRRVAPGLKRGQQDQIANHLLRELLPRNQKPVLVVKRAGAQASAEMWRCLGALEWVSAKRRLAVLQALLETEARLGDEHLWAVARLGARRPLYGPDDTIVPPGALAPLVPLLLERVRRQPSRMGAVAVYSLCHARGRRDLDLDDELRHRAERTLEKAGQPMEWSGSAGGQEEARLRSELAGDSLPLGLELA
jgi:molecular chaperone DnaK (HSP70)